MCANIDVDQSAAVLLCSYEAARDLGIPDEVRNSAMAYLVVSLESSHDDRLEQDVQTVAELLAELGSLDVYVLPPAAAGQLIEAREKAFWVAKANGADDIIDVVIPRAAIPEFHKIVDEAKARAVKTFADAEAVDGDGDAVTAQFEIARIEYLSGDRHIYGTVRGIGEETRVIARLGATVTTPIEAGQVREFRGDAGPVEF
jgi:hypothetical protein